MYWYDNFLSRVLKFELCDRELEMMTIRSRSPIPIHNPHYRLLLHQHHDKLLSCFSVMFPFLFFFYHLSYVFCIMYSTSFFFKKKTYNPFYLGRLFLAHDGKCLQILRRQFSRWTRIISCYILFLSMFLIYLFVRFTRTHLYILFVCFCTNRTTVGFPLMYLFMNNMYLG